MVKLLDLCLRNSSESRLVHVQLGQWLHSRRDYVRQFRTLHQSLVRWQLQCEDYRTQWLCEDSVVCQSLVRNAEHGGQIQEYNTSLQHRRGRRALLQLSHAVRGCRLEIAVSLRRAKLSQISELIRSSVATLFYRYLCLIKHPFRALSTMLTHIDVNNHRMCTLS